MLDRRSARSRQKGASAFEEDSCEEEPAALGEEVMLPGKHWEGRNHQAILDADRIISSHRDQICQNPNNMSTNMGKKAVATAWKRSVCILILRKGDPGSAVTMGPLLSLLRQVE